MNRVNHTAFTLIELLIVVAIIAILAAIAVPNFLEAQTRAKISRVKSDLRTYVTGLETYHSDWNKYPIWLDQYWHWHYDAQKGLTPLSTPVSYLSTSKLRDPFLSALRVLGPEGWDPNFGDDYIWAYYKWTGGAEGQAYPSRTFGDHWDGVPDLDACCILSLGPSTIHTVPEWALAMYQKGQYANACNQVYDPTNGTISAGGIVRYTGDTRGFLATK